MEINPQDINKLAKLEKRFWLAATIICIGITIIGIVQVVIWVVL